jgi:hypothetical protein
VPRPPAITTRASVSSGRALSTSSNAVRRVPSAAASRATGTSCAAPAPSATEAGNSVARTVNAFTGVAISTSARTFPAHIGRTNVTAAPSPPKRSTSVAMPASRSAAARGRTSLPKALAAAPTYVAPPALAMAASTGA